MANLVSYDISDDETDSDEGGRNIPLELCGKPESKSEFSRLGHDKSLRISVAAGFRQTTLSHENSLVNRQFLQNAREKFENLKKKREDIKIRKENRPNRRRRPKNVDCKLKSKKLCLDMRMEVNHNNTDRSISEPKDLNTVKDKKVSKFDELPLQDFNLFNEYDPHGKKKTRIEKDLDEAIHQRDFSLAEEISEEITLRETATSINHAFEAKRYLASQKEIVEKQKMKRKKLNWSFERKEKWEVKSNM